MEPTKRKPLTKLDRRRAAIKRQRDWVQLNKAEVSAQYRNNLVMPSKASPEEAAAQLDHHCPYCGALLIPRIETYDLPLMRDGKRTMFIWPDKHGCSEESAALGQQAIELSDAKTQQQLVEYKTMLVKAGLIGWLADANFDNYATREEWPISADNWQRVWAYISALLDGSIGDKKWLILYGSFGMGKSHLAAAAIQEALNAGWHQCYFRVWPEYLRRLQASWNRQKDDAGEWVGENEAQITEELQGGKLVVIDDLDKRQPTDWSRSVLYTALNHRYNAQLPTILTFNYGPDQADPKAPGRLALENYLGGAIFDRLIQSAYDVIEFNGPSYRSNVILRP